MNDFYCKVDEPASGYFALSLGITDVQNVSRHKVGAAVFEISDPNLGSVRDFQVHISLQDGLTFDIENVASVQISCTGMEGSCGLAAALVELAKEIVKRQGENDHTEMFR